MRRAGIALFLFPFFLFLIGIAPAQDRAGGEFLGRVPATCQDNSSQTYSGRRAEPKGGSTNRFRTAWLPSTTWAMRAALGCDAAYRRRTHYQERSRRNAKNLEYFDALVFVSTTGELDLDDSQKKDMMSFIKDDGKGFVGVHAALDTNYNGRNTGR